jgi:Ca2+-binding EF-hand superfamily protein
MTRRRLLAATLVFSWMCAGGLLQKTAFAQKASVPKQPNTVAITREKVKELLVLMDTDKNGKISKQEWMKFMEAEFDRLDTMKKGEIDQKELLHSISVGRIHTSDVGK